MRRISIVLFGDVKITAGGRSILLQPRCTSLVALLATASTLHRRRSELIDLLWLGDSSYERRHSLSQLLYYARRMLPGGIRATKDGSVGLIADNVCIDYQQALRAIDYQSADHLADLIREPLLGGSPLPPSPAYDIWREGLWADFARRAQPVLRSGLLNASRGGQWSELNKYVGALLLINPLDEDAHVSRALGLAGQGERAAALTAINCSLATYSEHSEEPPYELQQMCSALQGIAPAAGTAPETPMLGSTKLRGRGDELRELRNYWEICRGGERAAVLIAGPSGIGKTRIVTELGRVAALQGAQVLHTCCSPGDKGIGYATIGAAMTDGLPRATVHSLGDPWLPYLSHVVPELIPAGVNMPAWDHATASRAIAEAVSALIDSVAVNRPVVIIIDNLEWADHASRSVLQYLAYRRGGRGVLLALTVHSESLLSRDGRRLYTEFSGINLLHLRPIGDPAATQILTDSLTTVSPQPSPALRRRIVEQAGGSPLYIIEAVRALTLAPGGPASFEATLARNPRATVAHASVQDLLIGNLRALPRPARRVMAVLAVVGRPVSSEVLGGICGLKEPTLLDICDLLEQTSMVVHRESGLELAHDLLRDAIRSLMNEGRRRHLHERVALALEAAGESPPGVLAEHYAAGGRFRAARRHALAAAALSEAASALSSTEHFLKLATELATDENERAAALFELIRFYCSVGRLADAGQLLPEVRTGAGRRTSEQELLVELLHVTVDIANGRASNRQTWSSLAGLLTNARRSRFSEYVPRIAGALIEVAHDVGMRSFIEDFADEIAHEADAATGRYAAELYSISARAKCMYGDLECAARLAEKAVTIARQGGDVTVLIRATMSRGTAALCAGDVHKATLDFEDLWRLTGDLPLYHLRHRVVNNYAVLLMESGRFADAADLLEQALGTACGHDRVFLFGNLALLSIERSDADAAIGFSSQMVELAGDDVHWAWVVDKTVRGIAARLRDRYDEAAEHGRSLYSRYETVHAWIHDSSYTDVLIADALHLEGSDAAVHFLEQRSTALRQCNVPAAMRVEIRLATLRCNGYDQTRRDLRALALEASYLRLETIRVRALEALAGC